LFLPGNFCYGSLLLAQLLLGNVQDQAIQMPPLHRTHEGKTELPAADPQEGFRDARLLSTIRSGDERAMGELYDLYSSLVYSVALRVLGDTGAAEDVLQEVFLQLWRRPEAFDSSRGSLPAWLSVIARNRAIDSLRRQRPETDWSDVIISFDPGLAESAERRRAIEKVRDILNGMPAAQRSALEMAFFEGLTHAEIADKIGDPLGTVKTRIRTGLLALRQALST
jgi:RNA polymerase sigma-70 factor (ECF subfamily)